MSIKDVAKAAGVSITTVSRVINKVPTVSPDNRRKVEEVIRSLKFKPNVSAQRLASGSNNTIGLEIPRYEGVFYSFYAMEIFRSVSIACELLRVDLLLHLTDGKSGINAAAVGGVLFADVINNMRHVQDFIDLDIPCVIMNYVIRELPVSTVSIDNVKGAQMAVEYLANMGHKKIAFVTGDLATQAANDRLEGYQTVVERNGLSMRPEYIVRGDYSRKSARAAADRILDLEERPTSVFVSSDDMAMEMVSTFIERGLRVPQDISLIGFDDDPVCLYGPVALTTIRQPLKEMAQSAAKELYAMMQDPSRQNVHLVLPTELVIRDSVCAPGP